MDYPALYPRIKVNTEVKGLQKAKELGVNLSIVNPSIIVGKFLNSNYTIGMEMFKSFFTSKFYLKSNFAFIHVDDVVEAQI